MDRCTRAGLLPPLEKPVDVAVLVLDAKTDEQPAEFVGRPPHAALLRLLQMLAAVADA